MTEEIDPAPPFGTQAFWEHYRAKLTPCPCGGALVFTGAQAKATAWVYCQRDSCGHGSEPNHPICWGPSPEVSVPVAVELWNAFVADEGWTHSERRYSKHVDDAEP